MKGVLTMTIQYQSNHQVITEIKKLMLDYDISQRTIAKELDISPQGLTKLLNKKNFGFEDAEKILKAMGHTLVIDFKKLERENNADK